MKYCYLVGTVTESTKGCFTILSNQLVNMVRTMNTMSKSILPQFFFYCGVSWQKHAVWNILTVEKILYKYRDISLNSNIVCKEGKSVSRVIVYSSKNKRLPLPWWKGLKVINLLPGSWLIILENVEPRNQIIALKVTENNFPGSRTRV